MFYDAFAHTPMFALEALGFVGKGESGPFFEEMRTAPGGDFPLNTNGGGLSYTHTGMYGMFAIQESVRQLRGEAAAQLPDGAHEHRARRRRHVPRRRHADPHERRARVAPAFGRVDHGHRIVRLKWQGGERQRRAP